jgi:hypothetical protein
MNFEENARKLKHFESLNLKYTNVKCIFSSIVKSKIKWNK